MTEKINKQEFEKRLDGISPGNKLNGEIHEKFSKYDVYFDKISMNGLEDMHRYSTRESLYEFFEFSPFDDISSTKKYLEKLLSRMNSTDGEKNAIYWFVRNKIDNYLIGTAGLVNINFNRKSVEWSYGIDPNLWGKGFILQVQEMLKYFVFEILQFNRLDGVTMINNKRTISSLEAAGMRQEGILRQFYCKDGVFIDGWKYSMLRNEYLQQYDNSNNMLLNISANDVVEIISSILGDDGITENSTMANTEKWDSLNHMAIMVALFEKTKINLSPMQIANATSVLTITKLINGLNQ
jgi:[ribosomal protein S5]-alanine N-acetyltransferase